MRYLSLILLCVFSLQAKAQVTVNFRTGDHIYYMESPNDYPIHYQVDRENDMDGLLWTCSELTLYGQPECYVYFDPSVATITLRRTPGEYDYVVGMQDPLNPHVLAVQPNTAKQPIYYDNRAYICSDRYLVISTPKLTRATSFKLATNNRVFVFVTNPLTQKNL